MDWWIDGFWPWLDFGFARPGGSRSALPSTIFSTSFDTDFLMHLGTDLASIWDHFWTILVSFSASILRSLNPNSFPWNFNRKLESWNDGNSSFTRYSLRKQRNGMLWFYMHFGSDCGCISVSFSERSGMKFHMFQPLFFRMYFWMCF